MPEFRICLREGALVLGLTPMLLERSLQAQILIPLVTSLAFGMIAATTLLLFLIPALYSILHDFGVTTVHREATSDVST